MRDFNEELWKFMEMLDAGENFALNRFGDGELTAINRKDFDMVGVGKVNEFSYFKDSEKYNYSRNLLEDSFYNKQPNYFKGIPCHCCVLGNEALEIYNKLDKQDNWTWANIFVNGNYSDFKSYFPTTLENRNVIVVSHKKTKIDDLSFDVDAHITISSDAWVEDLEIIQEIIDTIEVYEWKDVVVLIAGGPFANIAVNELWKWNQNNTYLDIGSTLDPYLFGKPTRQYHAHNNPMGSKKCIWLDEVEEDE